jgi:hypothetical protein
VTDKKEAGAFTKEGAITWQVLALAFGIVWGTVQTLAAVRAMTKTDEVLVAIATLQQQVAGLTGFKADHADRLRSLEVDAQKTRERLVRIEDVKGGAKPATYQTRE